MRRGRPRKIRVKKSVKRKRSLTKHGMRNPKQIAAKTGRARVRRRRRRR